MEAPDAAGYDAAASPATAPSTPDAKSSTKTKSQRGGGTTTRGGSPEQDKARRTQQKRKPFSSPSSPSRPGRRPVMIIPTKPSRATDKKKRPLDGAEDAGSGGDDGDGDDERYSSAVHRDWFEKSGNLYFPVRTSSATAIPPAPSLVAVTPLGASSSGYVPTTTAGTTLASLAGRSIQHAQPAARSTSTSTSLSVPHPLRSPVPVHRALHLSPLARVYTGSGLGYGAAAPASPSLSPLSAAAAARRMGGGVRLDSLYDDDADNAVDRRQQHHLEIKEDSSAEVQPVRSRKEMLVAALAELQAELVELEKSEQVNGGPAINDEEKGSRKSRSSGFLRVTRGKGSGSAVRMSSGEEVIDIVGGYAAAAAAWSQNSTSDNPPRYGDGVEDDDDDDDDNEDDGYGERAYRGRAYNAEDEDDDEDEDDHRPPAAGGHYETVETTSGRRQQDQDQTMKMTGGGLVHSLYAAAVRDNYNDDDATGGRRHQQDQSMKMTGGGLVHSRYEAAVGEDYNGDGGGNGDDEQRVVSVGRGYLGHSKSFEYDEDVHPSNESDEDDDEEGEEEEEREEESDEHGGVDERGERRVTNGYYYDDDVSDDDDEEYAGKAIDAVYSTDHEPVGNLRDKSADGGDRQSRPKDSGGGRLLRNFMRHSGEHRRDDRHGGGNSGEKGKYFAGEGSMKASRRLERDERKRKAKEEKREKRSERKIKRMDRKLVAVGISKRKLDKDHEGNNEDERTDAVVSEDERKTSRMLAFRRKRRSMSEIEPSHNGSGIKGRDHAASAGVGGGHMAQRTLTVSGKVPHAGARRMVGGLGGSMELPSQDMAGGGVYSGEGRVKRAFERRVQEAKKRIGRKNKNMERKASTAETNAVLDVEAFLQDSIGTDWREKISQKDDAATLVTTAHATTAGTTATGGHIDHTPAAVAVASAVASATAISNKEQDASPLGRRQPSSASPNVVRRNVVGELPDSIWNHVAEVYGRIIISEQFVPLEEKTIRLQTHIGGVAGGSKYMCKGILFKFALDAELKKGLWMYGDDTADDSCALKAAGHELRSVTRVVDSGDAAAEGVAVPLITLVDYRGYRLTAISVLPVSKRTIVYGSHDAGKTVHATYPAFNEKFKNIFTRLNLKGHIVSSKLIHACGDIEGHWGSDGKLYLLDFARLYPPECVLVKERYWPSLLDARAMFYKLLRPELVQSYQLPLCSDAYTGMMRHDPNFVQHNEEVRQATETLLRSIIPSLAAEVQQLALQEGQRLYAPAMASRDNLNSVRFAAPRTYRPGMDAGDDDLLGSLSISTLHDLLIDVLHRMHSNGVNMRYLGVLRGHLTLVNNPEYGAFTKRFPCLFKGLLYTEARMAARVCKNMIRALLREKMRELKVPSSEPYKQLVVDLFNLFSHYSAQSNHFWTSTETPNVRKNLIQPTHPGERGLEYFIYKVCKQNHRLRRQRRKHAEEGGGGGGGGGGGREEDHYDNNYYYNYVDNPFDEYEKGESVEDIIPYLLPMKCCIRTKFSDIALSPEEWDVTDSRREPRLFPGLMFLRICEMMGIVLSDQPQIFDLLNGEQGHGYEFLEQDIIDLSVKVKHMHLISSSEGFALYQRCLEIERAAKNAAEERRATAATDHDKEGKIKDNASAATAGVSTGGGGAVSSMKATFDGKLSIMARKDVKGKEKEKEREKDMHLKEKTTAAGREIVHGTKIVQREVLDDRTLLEERLEEPALSEAPGQDALDDSALDGTTTKKIIRLLICSRRKLELALHSIPDSIQTLLHLGKVEYWLARLWDEKEEALRRDSFKAAYGYYLQGIMTLQKRNERGERRLLLQSKLEVAQLVCDWATAPADSLRDELKEETERILWQTATQEYRDILLAWPSLASAWRRDGQDVLLQLKATKQLPPGMVLATIMKTEAAWYLDEINQAAGLSSPGRKETSKMHEDGDDGDEKTARAKKKEKKEKEKEKTKLRSKMKKTKKKKEEVKDGIAGEENGGTKQNKIDFAWRDLEGMARQAVFALVKNLERDELVSQSALGDDSLTNSRTNRRHNTMLSLTNGIGSDHLVPVMLARKRNVLFDMPEDLTTTDLLSSAASIAASFVERETAGGIGRYLGREVFFVSPHGKYLCVVRRDGDAYDGQEGGLVLSTTDRMCCNAVFLLARVRGDSKPGGSGGEDLLCIRFGLNGHYLCMDDNGKPTLKHRKGLHTRYGAPTTKFWRYEEFAREHRQMFGFQTYHSDKVYRSRGPQQEEEARRTSMERKRGKVVASTTSLGSGAGAGKFLSSKRDGFVSLQACFKSNERWKLKLVDRHRIYLKSLAADRYLSVIANTPAPTSSLMSSASAPLQSPPASASAPGTAPPLASAITAGAVDASVLALGSAVMMAMSQPSLSMLASTSHVPNHVRNTFFIRPKKRYANNHHSSSGKDRERERDKSSVDKEAADGDENKIFIHAYDGRFLVVKDIGSEAVVVLSEDSMGQAWKYTEVLGAKDAPNKNNRRIQVELKNTKAKKWLRVDETGTAVLVASRQKGGGDRDQELSKQDKKDDKKRRKRDKIKEKLKDKLGSDNAVTVAEASGDDESGTARSMNRNTKAPAKAKAGATAEDASAAATKREDGGNSGFGWSVVRPSEETWASMLLLTELFADLNAAHAFDEERLAKLANLIA